MGEPEEMLGQMRFKTIFTGGGETKGDGKGRTREGEGNIMRLNVTFMK